MSDEPMRTVRDGNEVHPGLDADHRPELVPDPEPLEEPEASARKVDDTPMPATLDGKEVASAAPEPAEAKPTKPARKGKKD